MALRRNPTGPAVSLVAVAFRKQPELLRELRAADGPATIDNAARLLADMSGSSFTNIRSGALGTLSKFVRDAFDSPQEAVYQIVQNDHRLGVWCAAACAEHSANLISKTSAARAMTAIKATQKWVAEGGSEKKVFALGTKLMPTSLRYEQQYVSASAAYAAMSTTPDRMDGKRVRSPDQIGYAYSAVIRAVETMSLGASQTTPGWRGPSPWETSGRNAKEMVGVIADAIVTFPALREPGERRARKNPTGPSVSIVALAFRDRPELLRELRDTKGPATIDHAAELLAGWTGQTYAQVRQRALATLARYTRNTYAGDKRRRGGLLPTQRIITFLIERSHALGVWCACQCARAVFEQTTEPQARFCVMAAERWVRDDEIDANLPGFINAARTSTPLLGRSSYADSRAIVKDAANWSCAYAAESIANRSAASECVENAYDVAVHRVGMRDDAWLMDVIEKAIITFPSRI